jgi:hypothetical protein
MLRLMYLIHLLSLLCGRKPIRLWAGSCSSACACACVLRSCQGTCQRSTPQDLPSFLDASKRCSSKSGHRLCLLVLEQSCSASLEHPSSSLLTSGSLSLKPFSTLSPLAGSLPCDAALPFWGRVCVASTWLRPAPPAVDIFVPLDESRDGVCPLKPVKRNECCCNGLVVKSSSMSWAT